jgi:hypothetical protein
MPTKEGSGMKEEKQLKPESWLAQSSGNERPCIAFVDERLDILGTHFAHREVGKLDHWLVLDKVLNIRLSKGLTIGDLGSQPIRHQLD